jgi:hypothetical protein
MAKLVRFHNKVASDIKNAVDRYDSISLRLGIRVRAAIKTRIAAIKERPESFGRLAGNRRAAMVKGFPYLVLFLQTSTHVIILGVYHSGSDSAIWLERSM